MSEVVTHRTESERVFLVVVLLLTGTEERWEARQIPGCGRAPAVSS